MKWTSGCWCLLKHWLYFFGPPTPLWDFQVICSCIFFWRTLILFHVLINDIKRLPFAIGSPTFITLWFLLFRHLWGTYEAIAYCSFSLHLPDDYWCWLFFRYLPHNCVSPSYIFLRSLSYFYLGNIFVYYWVAWGLCILGVITVYQLYE